MPSNKLTYLTLTLLSALSSILVACGSPRAADPSVFTQRVRTLPADAQGTAAPNSVSIDIPNGSLKVTGFNIVMDVPESNAGYIFTASSKGTITTSGMNFSFDIVTQHNGVTVNSTDDDFQGYNQSNNSYVYYTGRCAGNNCSDYYLSVWIFLYDQSGNMKANRQFGYKKVNTDSNLGYVALDSGRSVDMDTLVKILDGQMK